MLGVDILSLWRVQGSRAWTLSGVLMQRPEHA